jgi:hypothetical protein
MVPRRARGRWSGWLFPLRRPLRRLAVAAGAARVVVVEAAAPQAPVVAELRPVVAEAEVPEGDVAAEQALVRLAVEAEAAVAPVAALQQRWPPRSPW